jgi:hypothetical protein
VVRHPGVPPPSGCTNLDAPEGAAPSRRPHPVRRIYLDGRALPKSADREDFYNGNNIGHYRGKDLVAEAAGFKPLWRWSTSSRRLYSTSLR